MRPPEASTASKDAYAELHARFRGPLLSFFLRRLKDRSEAEDLTQEVLLRALRAQGLIRAERPDAFIFKIAINLLRDRRRQEQRRGATGFIPLDEAEVDGPGSPLVEDFSPERVLLGKQSLENVMRALGELEERTRSIFILFRLENMKQRDIAALLGIGQSTVEKHVVRAILHLAARCDADK
jgi:RNA polymerase sigma factor (sigma-70 family)